MSFSSFEHIEQDLQRGFSAMGEPIAPYVRFVRAEKERNDSAMPSLSQIRDEVKLLRLKVETRSSQFRRGSGSDTSRSNLLLHHRGQLCGQTRVQPVELRTQGMVHSGFRTEPLRSTGLAEDFHIFHIAGRYILPESYVGASHEDDPATLKLMHALAMRGAHRGSVESS